MFKSVTYYDAIMLMNVMEMSPSEIKGYEKALNTVQGEVYLDICRIGKPSDKSTKEETAMLMELSDKILKDRQTIQAREHIQDLLNG